MNRKPRATQSYRPSFDENGPPPRFRNAQNRLPQQNNQPPNIPSVNQAAQRYTTRPITTQNSQSAPLGHCVLPSNVPFYSNPREIETVQPSCPNFSTQSQLPNYQNLYLQQSLALNGRNCLPNQPSFYQNRRCSQINLESDGRSNQPPFNHHGGAVPNQPPFQHEGTFVPNHPPFELNGRIYPNVSSPLHYSGQFVPNQNFPQSFLTSSMGEQIVNGEPMVPYYYPQPLQEYTGRTLICNQNSPADQHLDNGAPMYENLYVQPPVEHNFVPYQNSPQLFLSNSTGQYIENGASMHSNLFSQQPCDYQLQNHSQLLLSNSRGQNIENSAPMHTHLSSQYQRQNIPGQNYHQLTPYEDTGQNRPDLIPNLMVQPPSDEPIYSIREPICPNYSLLPHFQQIQISDVLPILPPVESTSLMTEQLLDNGHNYSNSACLPQNLLSMRTGPNLPLVPEFNGNEPNYPTRCSSNVKKKEPGSSENVQQNVSQLFPSEEIREEFGINLYTPNFSENMDFLSFIQSLSPGTQFPIVDHRLEDVLVPYRREEDSATNTRSPAKMASRTFNTYNCATIQNSPFQLKHSLPPFFKSAKSNLKWARNITKCKFSPYLFGNSPRHSKNLIGTLKKALANSDPNSNQDLASLTLYANVPIKKLKQKIKRKFARFRKREEKLLKNLKLQPPSIFLKSTACQEFRAKRAIQKMQNKENKIQELVVSPRFTLRRSKLEPDTTLQERSFGTRSVGYQQFTGGRDLYLGKCVPITKPAQSDNYSSYNLWKSQEIFLEENEMENLCSQINSLSLIVLSDRSFNLV